MAGRNGTRKPGTACGSRRRSRTAKASHISAKCAVKLRCAREWGGWGQLSEDGTGQNNPRLSEGSWGGGLPTLHDGAGSRRSPDAERGVKALGKVAPEMSAFRRTGENPPYDCFQPTMSRWENASDLRSVIRLGRVMLDLWLASYPAPDAHLNRIWLSSGLSEAQESPGRQ